MCTASPVAVAAIVIACVFAILCIVLIVVVIILILMLRGIYVLLAMHMHACNMLVAVLHITHCLTLKMSL